MKQALRHLLTSSMLLAMAAVADADVVTDWHDIAIAAGYTAQLAAPQQARALAMAQLAVFEAVNSIEPRYTPYRARLEAPPGASREAAAAAAAYGVLAHLYPKQAPDFGAALQRSLAPIADGAAKTDGQRVGERAAAAMIAERSGDGADAPNNYRPYTKAGQYVPTALPVFSHWGAVKPFALKSGSQFRPAAPYALQSAAWARDYNEVKRMGAKDGSARSVEQTEIGRFWELTGAATYGPLAKQVLAAKNVDLVDGARLLALVAIATADATIAVFDAKYAYSFWRPITAIRNGDIDGNADTERDAAWEPLVPTPLHPEYPCAHCITQGSAAAVLESAFGDAIPTVKLTSSTAPGVTRSYSRLSDYVAEVINARIYGGMHYRSSGEIGAAMGRMIADYTVQNVLKPSK